MMEDTGQLGGHLSGQQRECGQAQNRAHPQGQRLGQTAAVRVRPGSCPNALRAQGQVRRVGHPQRPQEVGRGAGPQDAAHGLRHAGQGTHYQDKEIDYEALNVQRNAPRWIKMLRKHGFIATPAAT